MNNNADIVILEDDVAIGKVLQLALSTVSDNVSYYPESTTFFIHINKKLPSLIIMDMLLSGANGSDICRQLKADVETSHIPIIMMSAHSDARQLCEAANANHFLPKPFDMKDLLDSAQRLLKK